MRLLADYGTARADFKSLVERLGKARKRLTSRMISQARPLVKRFFSSRANPVIGHFRFRIEQQNQRLRA